MKALFYIAPVLLLALFVMYQKGLIFINFENIDSGRMRSMIVDNENNVTILDVRTLDEYKSGHIKNSVLIPHNEVKNELEKLSTSKNKTLLVYCRSGFRSAGASRVLADAGFKVYNLQGGISAWVNSGYDVQQ
jgi:rhodanese-related sulfurtransferase